jgi:hypothetical protein
MLTKDKPLRYKLLEPLKSLEDNTADISELNGFLCFATNNVPNNPKITNLWYGRRILLNFTTGETFFHELYETHIDKLINNQGLIRSFREGLEILEQLRDRYKDVKSIKLYFIDVLTPIEILAQPLNY